MPIRIGVKAVLTYRNKILLLERSQHISRGGTWDLPGGMIDPQEKLLEGLQREVFEESGIKIEKVIHPLHVGYFNAGIYRYKNVIRIIYFTKVNTTKVKLSGEHSDYTWIKLRKMKEVDPIYFIDPGIYTNLLKRIEFAMKCKGKDFEEKVS